VMMSVARKGKTMRFGTFVKMLKLSGIVKPPRRSSNKSVSSKGQKNSSGATRMSERKKI